jgi:hypothetical protein
VQVAEIKPRGEGVFGAGVPGGRRNHPSTSRAEGQGPDHRLSGAVGSGRCCRDEAAGGCGGDAVSPARSNANVAANAPPGSDSTLGNPAKECRKGAGRQQRLLSRPSARLPLPGFLRFLPSLARISHHESAAPAQPPASPGRVLVRVLDILQVCLRARTCGPARIYVRLHGLATIPGEKCGLEGGRTSRQPYGGWRVEGGNRRLWPGGRSLTL